jgi:molybdopterin-guanine dinucleotide biosynthesis protein B
LVKMIAVIGSSRSGKTSTVEYLVSRLTAKRLKVGSVKHVHDHSFTIDAAGKDTWRHAKAGAKRVVCISRREVAIIRKERGDTYTLESILSLFRDEEFDLIILEGFQRLVSKRTDVGKILTAKNKEDVKRLLRIVKPPIIAITGAVSIKEKGSVQGIPIVDVRRDGAQLVNAARKLARSAIQRRQ